MSEEQHDRRHAAELVSDLDPLVTALSRLARVREVFTSGIDVNELAPVIAVIVTLADAIGEAAVGVDDTADRIIAERNSAPLWVQRTASLSVILDEIDEADWGMRTEDGDAL